MHICIYVKYCFAIEQAAEPQATRPTGKRANGPESAMDVPGGSLEGHWITKCSGSQGI